MLCEVTVGRGEGMGVEVGGGGGGVAVINTFPISRLTHSPQSSLSAYEFNATKTKLVTKPAPHLSRW